MSTMSTLSFDAVKSAPLTHLLSVLLDDEPSKSNFSSNQFYYKYSTDISICAQLAVLVRSSKKFLRLIHTTVGGRIASQLVGGGH